MPPAARTAVRACLPGVSDDLRVDFVGFDGGFNVGEVESGFRGGFEVAGQVAEVGGAWDDGAVGLCFFEGDGSDGFPGRDDGVGTEVFKLFGEDDGGDDVAAEAFAQVGIEFPGEVDGGDGVVVFREPEGLHVFMEGSLIGQPAACQVADGEVKDAAFDFVEDEGVGVAFGEVEEFRVKRFEELFGHETAGGEPFLAFRFGEELFGGLFRAHIGLRFSHVELFVFVVSGLSVFAGAGVRKGAESGAQREFFKLLRGEHPFGEAVDLVDGKTAGAPRSVAIEIEEQAVLTGELDDFEFGGGVHVVPDAPVEAQKDSGAVDDEYGSVFPVRHGRVFQEGAGHAGGGDGEGEGFVHEGVHAFRFKTVGAPGVHERLLSDWGRGWTGSSSAKRMPRRKSCSAVRFSRDSSFFR